MENGRSRMGGVNGLGHMMDLHMHEGNERRLLQDEKHLAILLELRGLSLTSFTVWLEVHSYSMENGCVKCKKGIEPRHG